jgi:integrase
MSVYRPKGTKTYVYDFQWRRRRFSGSTGFKSKREAEQVERDRRDAVLREAAAAQQRAAQPLTLDLACDRYWIEVGQHAKSAMQIEWSIDYLLNFFGPDKLLRDITEADVAMLVSKRRADRVDNINVRRHRPSKETKRVTPATVNRSVTEPLRRIMLRARDVWGKEIGRVEWRKHRLKEPKERIRSMSADEEGRLFTVLPAAYAPIIRFALRTGCRAMECINLRWSDIDWGNRRITISGKGGKVASIPMSMDVRDLLFPMQNGAEFVFLMPPNRREPSRRMTYRALYSAFFEATQRAAITGLRIHDLRHTAATRLVQATGNLKMAQKLLRHEDISTTAKYAAVLDEDLRNALDMMATHEVPVKAPKDTPKPLIDKIK